MHLRFIIFFFDFRPVPYYSFPFFFFLPPVFLSFHYFFPFSSQFFLCHSSTQASISVPLSILLLSRLYFFLSLLNIFIPSPSSGPLYLLTHFFRSLPLHYSFLYSFLLFPRPNPSPFVLLSLFIIPASLPRFFVSRP